MNEAISLIGSYGYDALLGAAGYHLFPDLVGVQDDETLSKCLAHAEKLYALVTEQADPFIRGEKSLR